LNQNYPNPFNPSTTIKFSVPQSGFVKIVVYDLAGSELETLVNQSMNAGSYEVNFDASDLASGVYIYRMIAGDYNFARKMSVLK
jgi:hypothetical protein